MIFQNDGKGKNVRRYAMCHSSLYVSHSWRYSKMLRLSLWTEDLRDVKDGLCELIEVRTV